MSINLGGGDTGVAEHHLHAPNVRAVLEEVGREGMSDDVRGHPFRDTGLRRIVSYYSLHTAAVQTAVIFAFVLFGILSPL